MRLTFKQKAMSLLDSYEVFDDKENIVYTVKGKFAFGKTFEVYDRNGRLVGAIKQKLMVLIPQFDIYQDDICAAINDINPQAPVHVLLFPKKPIERLSKAEQSDADTLAHLMLTVPQVAKICGLENGFRVVINNGKDAGETVPHMHIHILGGTTLGWPPC